MVQWLPSTRVFWLQSVLALCYHSAPSVHAIVPATLPPWHWLSRAMFLFALILCLCWLQAGISSSPSSYSWFLLIFRHIASTSLLWWSWHWTHPSSSAFDEVHATLGPTFLDWKSPLEFALVPPLLMSRFHEGWGSLLLVSLTQPRCSHSILFWATGSGKESCLGECPLGTLTAVFFGVVDPCSSLFVSLCYAGMLCDFLLPYSCQPL